MPDLRGFGPTRFTSESTPRSRQQAAVGRDVLELVQTLGLGCSRVATTSAYAPAYLALAVRDLHAFLEWGG
jgi:hypothetical protein